MFSFTDRLKKLRGKESQEAFAARFGLHRNTISQYERGISIPSSDFLEQLVEAYDVNQDWLLHGDESESASDGHLHTHEGSGRSDFVYIPLVEAISAAGHGSSEVSEVVIEEFAFKKQWIKSQGNPQNMVLLTVRGDSMEPLIHDKDMVLVDLSRKEVELGKVFAVGYEDYIFVKRLILEPGRLILRSENKEYNDIIVNLRDPDEAEQVRIIGKVIWWCHDEK